MVEINRLESLAQRPNLVDFSFNELLSVLAADAFVQPQPYADLCQLDPRDGSMIIYAEHRSLRQDQHKEQSHNAVSHCPICHGQLTQVVDTTLLSDGFTFISQNRYPILYPENLRIEQTGLHSLYPDPQHLGRYAYGFHLLQWSSSVHDHDWHNMPLNDVHIGLKRLALLEEKLLKESSDYMPISDQQKGLHGYVSIIKNFGSSAGASLTHGHQQIAFSNIMPQRTFNNQRFFIRHDETFSHYLRRENPKHLTVAEQGNIRVLVPYFMRRPYNLILLPETDAEHLYELPNAELRQLADTIQQTMQVYHQLLPTLNKEVSFNMAIHSGPNSHLYVEFFPMVQIMGGFEKIGMWICQVSAMTAAEQLKAIFQQREKGLWVN